MLCWQLFRSDYDYRYWILILDELCDKKSGKWKGRKKVFNGKFIVWMEMHEKVLKNTKIDFKSWISSGIKKYSIVWSVFIVELYIESRN